MNRNQSDSPRSGTSPTYGEPEVGGSPKRKRAESQAAMRGRKAHGLLGIGSHDIQGLDIMVAPVALKTNSENLLRRKNNLQNTPVVSKGEQGCSPSLNDATGTPGDLSGYTDGHSSDPSSYSASPAFLVEALHPPAAAAFTLLTGPNSANKRASARHRATKNISSTVAQVATRHANLRNEKARERVALGLVGNTSARPADSNVSSEGDNNSFLHLAPRGSRSRRDNTHAHTHTDGYSYSMETSGEEGTEGEFDTSNSSTSASGLFDGDSGMGHSSHGIAFGASPQQMQIPYVYGQREGYGHVPIQDRGAVVDIAPITAAQDASHSSNSSVNSSLNSSVGYGIPALALDSPLMSHDSHRDRERGRLRGSQPQPAPTKTESTRAGGGGGDAESKPIGPIDPYSLDEDLDGSALSSISPVISSSPSSFLKEADGEVAISDMIDMPLGSSDTVFSRKQSQQNKSSSSGAIGIARTSLRSSRDVDSIADVDRLTGHAAASPTVPVQVQGRHAREKKADSVGSGEEAAGGEALPWGTASSSSSLGTGAGSRMFVNGLYGGAQLNMRDRSNSTAMPPHMFSGEPSSSALRRTSSQDADSDMEEEIGDSWGIMGDDLPLVQGNHLRFTPLGLPDTNTAGSPQSPEMYALGAQVMDGFATAEQSPPLPVGGGGGGDNSGMAGRLSSLSVGHPEARRGGGACAYSSDEDGGQYVRVRGGKCSPVLPYGSASFREALRTASAGDLDDEGPVEIEPRIPGGSSRVTGGPWHALSLHAATPKGEAAAGGGGGRARGQGSHFLDTPTTESVGDASIGSPIAHLADADDDEEEEDGIGFRLLAASGGAGSSSSSSPSGSSSSNAGMNVVPGRRRSNPAGSMDAAWRMHGGTLGARASGRRAHSASFNEASMCSSPTQDADGSSHNMNNGSLNLSRSSSNSSSSSNAGAAGGGGPGGRPLPDQSAFDRSSGTAKYEQSSSPVCPATPMRTPTWSHDNERKNLERLAMGSSEDYTGTGMLMPALLRQNSLQSSKLLLSGSGESAGTGDDAAQAVDFRRDFVDEGLLGSGTFADVYRVRARATGEVFAVKKSKRQFRSRKDREWLLHEVRSMQRVSAEYSEYVVQLIRAWQENGYFYVQVELAERGTLKDLLMDLSLRGQAVPDNTVWHILYDVCQGLHHVHSAGLVHLDVKPANLLVTHAGLVKIGDFGMAAVIGQGEDGREGDTRYMAPELLESSDRQPSADVFSLGLTLYELCLPPAPLVPTAHESHHSTYTFSMQNAPAVPHIHVGSGLPFEGPSWHLLREGKAEPLPNRPAALLAAIARAMAPCPTERALPIDLAGLPEAAATKSDVDVTLTTARPRIISTAANMSPRSSCNLASHGSNSVTDLQHLGHMESGAGSSSRGIGFPVAAAGGGGGDNVMPSRAGNNIPPLQIPAITEQWTDHNTNLAPRSLGQRIPSVSGSCGSGANQHLRVTTPTGELHGTQFWRVQPLAALGPGLGLQVCPAAPTTAPLATTNVNNPSQLYNSRSNFRSVTNQQQSQNLGSSSSSSSGNNDGSASD